MVTASVCKRCLGAIFTSMWICLMLPSIGVAQSAEPQRPNVLLIAVDDLNHWIGYTGRNPQAKTPNIDRLSNMGVSFTHAYCAAPLCNPSRTALMSGKRPSTTACYQNADNWKEYIPPGIGLAATFKSAGYYVAGAGKIYHGSTYYRSEWDDYFDEKGFGAEEDESGDKARPRRNPIGKLEGFHTPVAHDLQDSDLADWHIVDYCIEQLAKPHDRPFFLACGVHKPHLPWVVPRKYYEMFPVESIQLPPFQPDDLDDVPAGGVRMASSNGDHEFVVEHNRWKYAIQSYLATIAYTDMNMGRLLDALEKSAYANNTIICFWGDHGWHLGEKLHWRKFTLWEEATRAPLIWVAPGVTTPGTLCTRTVDFMSIYPTLCELAGITVPNHVEGMSIRRLLDNPQAEWDQPGVTTYGYRNHAVRSEEWRYIQYQEGGEELYDEVQDPYEWTNQAGSAEFASRKRELSEFLPAVNTPPRVKREAKSAKKAKSARESGKKQSVPRKDR